MDEKTFVFELVVCPTRYNIRLDSTLCTHSRDLVKVNKTSKASTATANTTMFLSESNFRTLNHTEDYKLTNK